MITTLNYKINKTIINIFILTLFYTGNSYSQRTENAVNFSNMNSRLVIEVENDILFNTDSYYTAGQAISYSNKEIIKMPTQLMLSLITNKDMDITGFGIQQKIFTPYSIENPDSIKNDRPYSAYILISNYSVFINTKHKILFSNEIGIGAMGPVAVGKQAQTFVHSIIGSPKPIGWENQLNNAFLIDYTFRVEKSFFNGFIAEHFIPFAETRIGTLTDRIKLGLKFRIGNKNRYMIKLANKQYNVKKIVWEYIFVLNRQGVFYDATLEGGLFNKKETVELPKHYIIEKQYQLRMGINFYYKRFSFRYMINYNSKDFSNAVIHKYGSANFGYSF